MPSRALRSLGGDLKLGDKDNDEADNDEADKENAALRTRRVDEAVVP
jgi:hypothetical protein